MLNIHARLHKALKHNNWSAAEALLANDLDLTIKIEDEALYQLLLERAPDELTAKFFRQHHHNITDKIVYSDLKNLYIDMGLLAKTMTMEACLEKEGGLSPDKFQKEILQGAIIGRQVSLVRALSQNIHFSVNTTEANGQTLILNALDDDNVEWFELLREKGAYLSTYYGEEEDETLFYRAVKNGAWNIATHMAKNPGTFNVWLHPGKANELIRFTLDNYLPMRPNREQADIIASRLMIDTADTYNEKNIKITMGDALTNSLEQGLERTLQVGFAKNLFKNTEHFFSTHITHAANSTYFNLDHLKSVTKLFNKDWHEVRLDTLKHFLTIDNFDLDELNPILSSNISLTDRFNAILNDIEGEANRREAYVVIHQGLKESLGKAAKRSHKNDNDNVSYRQALLPVLEDFVTRYGHNFIQEELTDALHLALMHRSDKYKLLLELGANPNDVSSGSFLTRINNQLTQEPFEYARLTQDKWHEIYEDFLDHGLTPQNLQESYNARERLDIFDRKGPLSSVESPQIMDRLLSDGFYVTGPKSPLESYLDISDTDELECIYKLLEYQRNLNVDDPQERLKIDFKGVSHFILEFIKLNNINLNKAQEVAQALQFRKITNVNSEDPSGSEIIQNIMSHFPAFTVSRETNVYNDPRCRALQYLAYPEYRTDQTAIAIREAFNVQLFEGKQYLVNDGRAEWSTNSAGLYLLNGNIPTKGLMTTDGTEHYHQLLNIFKESTFSLCADGVINETGENIAHLTLRHGAEMFNRNRDYIRAELFITPDRQGVLPIDHLPDGGENEKYWRVTNQSASRSERFQKKLSAIFSKCLQVELDDDIRLRLQETIDRVINENNRAELMTVGLKQSSKNKTPKKRARL